MHERKFLKRLKSYFFQNVESCAIILLLSLAIVVLLGYCYHVRQELPKHVDIVGTFATKTTESINTTYLVFDQDGGFTKYDFSGILEEGTYIFTENPDREAADRIDVKINAENGSSFEMEMLLFGAQVYCFDEKTRQFCSYEKESNIPVFRDVHLVD